MANCDNLFKEFDKIIKLSESKKDSLRTSRDSLRKKTKEKFKIDKFEAEKYKDKNYEIKGEFNPMFTVNIGPMAS